MAYKYQPFNPQDYGIAPSFFKPGNTPNYQPMAEQQAGPSAGSPGSPGSSYQFPPDFFDFEQPNLDKFTSHLGARPQRGDYDPGTMDRILAMVIGGATGYNSPGSGGAAARNYLDQPYNQALDDWSLEAQSLEGMAGLDLQTSQNKAAILQAIQEGDLDRIKLMLEEQRNKDQAERWQGQTAADMGRVGVDEAELGLRGEELGLDRERLGLDRQQSGALQGLYGSRSGLYDAMAEEKEFSGQEGRTSKESLARSDYLTDPSVFRAVAPLEVQEFFELSDQTGRMELVSTPHDPWGPEGPDWQGFEKARQWYRKALGEMGQLGQ